MTFLLPAASLLGGTLLAFAGTSSEPGGLLGCLGSLLVFTLLSILSFFILKARSFLNGSGKEKPDFTSLRSTGKTIMNAAPPDEDEPDQFGGVN